MRIDYHVVRRACFAASYSHNVSIHGINGDINKILGTGQRLGGLFFYLWSSAFDGSLALSVGAVALRAV